MKTSSTDPEQEARAIVGELRAELGFPITLARVVRTLRPEERQVLRRLTRAAREERQTAARAEQAADQLGADAPADRTRSRVFRFTGE